MSIKAVRLDSGTWRASLWACGAPEVETFGNNEGDSVALLLPVAESRAAWLREQADELSTAAASLRRRAASIVASVARERGTR
jgi:hypothetical protein